MVTSNNVLAHFSDSDLALTTDFDPEEFSIDILEHHGVKGMRWGVRKDRKKSGSGSSRKSSDKKSIIKGVSGESVKKAASKASSTAVSKVKDLVKERKEKRQAAKAEAEKQKEKQKPLTDALEKHKKQSSNTVNPKYKELTNDDLRALNERMRLEREYDDLVAARSKQNRTTSQKMADWAKDTTVSVASDLAKQQMRKYGEQILSEAIGGSAKSVKTPKVPKPPTPAKSSSNDALKKLMTNTGTKALSSIAPPKSKGNSVSARELIERYGGKPVKDRTYRGRHRK